MRIPGKEANKAHVGATTAGVGAGFGFYLASAIAQTWPETAAFEYPIGMAVSTICGWFAIYQTDNRSPSP